MLQGIRLLWWSNDRGQVTKTYDDLEYDLTAWRIAEWSASPYRLDSRSCLQYSAAPNKSELLIDRKNGSMASGADLSVDSPLNYANRSTIISYQYGPTESNKSGNGCQKSFSQFALVT
jgi:hypothetical protein